MTDNPSQDQIRSRIRQKRQSLSQQYVAQHTEQLMHHLLGMPHFNEANKIASYMAFAGEADPRPLLTSDKMFYLPRIHQQQMSFHQWQDQADLFENQFGILEPPACAPPISPQHLDLVLMPLVAFDQSGHRIGMGGGYYDRLFQFRQYQTAPPLLIGLAYAFQETNEIITQSWDVSMDAVVTEEGWRLFS